MLPLKDITSSLTAAFKSGIMKKAVKFMRKEIR